MILGIGQAAVIRQQQNLVQESKFRIQVFELESGLRF